MSKFLVKIRQPGGRGMAAKKSPPEIRLAGKSLQAEVLFDLTRAAKTGLGFENESECWLGVQWPSSGLGVGATDANPWDQAHEILVSGNIATGQIVAVEPDLPHPHYNWTKSKWELRCNFWRRRTVPDGSVFHESVRIRYGQNWARLPTTHTFVATQPVRDS